MKGELGGKLTTQFAALRPKAYSYLADGNDKNKKVKDIKLKILNLKIINII